VIILKSPGEIARIAANGELLAEILERIGEAVQPGVTTLDLDRLAEEAIRSWPGAAPSFKGYNGFPASICASINDEVVHGIPSADRRLEEGDIISIDIGLLRDGYHADSAKTFPVGKVDTEALRLLAVTEACLFRGLAELAPGKALGDMAAAIQEHAEGAGFNVVRELVGHGIGRRLHEDPQVPNYGTRGEGLRLRPGMVLAIEPMVNAGGARVETLDDEWTIRTVDGSRSAHFEHTAAITEDGYRILTRVIADPAVGTRSAPAGRTSSRELVVRPAESFR
jgi:methionyl aminopeptidase